MIGKMKKWLGIEGVKVELDIPEFAFERVGAISGKLRFFTKHPQTVEHVRVKLVERYSRGRGKDKLVDEYVLGEVELTEPFEVRPEEMVDKEFLLPFTLLHSDMDRWQRSNPLTGGLVRVAKMLRKVRSDYRVEAEARVRGTALHPFDRKPVRILP